VQALRAQKNKPTTMKIRGVDFVLLRVSDLSRAVQFYRDVLGLKLETHSVEYQWAELDCGNVTLSLRGGETPVAGAGARVTLAVDDIDRAHAELTARGAPVPGPIQDFGVCRAFEVLDPDGNALLLHRRADGSFGPSP
jgi:predicted enzyme related to lactoylglutathione lyase